MAILGCPTGEYPVSCHQSLSYRTSTTLPSWIVAERRIASIVTRAHRIISDIELEMDPKSLNMTLKSLIPTLDAELMSFREHVESKGEENFL